MLSYQHNRLEIFNWIWLPTSRSHLKKLKERKPTKTNFLPSTLFSSCRPASTSFDGGHCPFIVLFHFFIMNQNNVPGQISCNHSTTHQQNISLATFFFFDFCVKNFLSLLKYISFSLIIIVFPFIGGVWCSYHSWFYWICNVRRWANWAQINIVPYYVFIMDI